MRDKGLCLLIKMWPVSWAATGGLIIGNILDVRTFGDSGLTVFCAALAITGTLLYAGKRYMKPADDPVEVLFDALLAEYDALPPSQARGAVLRVVRSDGRSGSPAGHRSAG